MISTSKSSNNLASCELACASDWLITSSPSVSKESKSTAAKAADDEASAIKASVLVSVLVNVFIINP